MQLLAHPSPSLGRKVMLPLRPRKKPTRSTANTGSLTTIRCTGTGTLALVRTRWHMYVIVRNAVTPYDLSCQLELVDLSLFGTAVGRQKNQWHHGLPHIRLLYAFFSLTKHNCMMICSCMSSFLKVYSSWQVHGSMDKHVLTMNYQHHWH